MEQKRELEIESYQLMGSMQTAVLSSSFMVATGMAIGAI